MHMPLTRKKEKSLCNLQTVLWRSSDGKRRAKSSLDFGRQRCERNTVFESEALVWYATSLFIALDWWPYYRDCSWLRTVVPAKTTRVVQLQISIVT